ncbi:hypothetical protein KUTeg_015149 [Tegillarca granosa]|uniref:Uncharacterized protein n=1 Tax=Tegillarca granosa TaxID=220873 RepID=A0ABQ9EUI3_TEGGR|nr:hypothetical protein KUTeg_015149 [Tegillarca granosa]
MKSVIDDIQGKLVCFTRTEEKQKLTECYCQLYILRRMLYSYGIRKINERQRPLKVLYFVQINDYKICEHQMVQGYIFDENMKNKMFIWGFEPTTARPNIRIRSCGEVTNYIKRHRHLGY